MIEKIITAVYIAVFAGVVVSIFRKDLTLEKEEAVRKIMAWICFGYIMAISLIFVKGYDFGNFHYYILLLSLCPLLWLVLVLCKKYDYRGPLNLFLAAVLLTQLGIVVLYRLKLVSKGLLARIFMDADGIPVVLNHMTFSIMGLILVSLLLFSGRIRRSIDWIDQKTGSMAWGIASMFFLMLPWVMKKMHLASSVGGTSSWILNTNSGQVSEFVYKILFVIFMAKFLSSRAFDLNYYNDQRNVMKIILLLVGLTGVFFFFPIVCLQRELGTSLLIAFTFITMVYIATGRLYFLVIGFLLIALAMAVGTIVSTHVEERIVGGWLNWKDYAFKQYSGGSGNWPGFQLFHALSAVRGSNIWGTGLTQGFPKIPHITNDFIFVPVAEELGILGVVLVMAVFILFVKVWIAVGFQPSFRGFLTSGLPLTLLFQAFYNLTAVLGKMPLTGIPVPFLSNGGSSIIASFIIVAFMTELIRQGSVVRS